MCSPPKAGFLRILGLTAKHTLSFQLNHLNHSPNWPEQTPAGNQDATSLRDNLALREGLSAG